MFSSFRRSKILLLINVGAGALLAMSVFLGACSDDDAMPSDGGGDLVQGDLLQGHDGGSDGGLDGHLADAGVDHMVADSGPRACSQALDLVPLTLASTYCVGARVTTPAGTSAFAFGPEDLVTFESGAAARSFGVRRRALNLDGTTLGSSTDVFSFTVAGTQDLFSGHYLAMAPTGGIVAVGYTLKDQSGGIELGAAGSAPTEIAGTGNYDAIYLDADTLLVNGQGLGAVDKGHAVYAYKAGAARALITDAGSFSGFIAVGAHVLFAGGYTTKNEIWAFSLAEVKAAIAGGTTLSAKTDGDLVYAGPITDAATLGDDLVFVDDDFVTFNAVRRVAITVTGDSVSAGATTDIVTPGTSGAKVTGLSAQGLWLGLRFTTSATGGVDTLALVRAK